MISQVCVGINININSPEYALFLFLTFKDFPDIVYGIVK